MIEPTPVLEVRDLFVEFQRPDGVARVVNGVSFSIGRGEILGLVGESGSGKSVLVRAILNLIDPPGKIVGGEVLFEGRSLLAMRDAELRALRGGAIGTVVPNPHRQLNPLESVGSQVMNVIRAHTPISRGDARSESVGWLAKVGIPDPVQRARSMPHELSGGMAQRVVIANALANSPRLILADEPTGGLDVTVQLQVVELMRNLVTEFGASMLLITRDLGIVSHFCDRLAVLYAGQIIEDSPVRQFFDQARHPYSLELLRSASPAHRALGRLGKAEPIIDPVRLPSGCLFHPRCLIPIERCREEMPERNVLGEGQAVRCHLARRGEGVPAA